MSWETRRGCGPYYTRSRTIKGRVFREYIGGGAVGHKAAAEDELARQHRTHKAQQLKAERSRLQSLEDRTKSLEALCAAALKLELKEYGYQLRRGEWRRQRSG